MSVVLCTYKRPASVAQFLDSLLLQSRPPDELLVVDASRDSATSALVSDHPIVRRIAVSYWRVEDPLRGLTRQRNFALDNITCDLVGFFDDDVVLDSRCLREMERAHRAAPDLAGVGCFAEPATAPTALWQLRRALGMVPDLRPGSYTSSGMSVPWCFQQATEDAIEGDWLPGCAMMLRSEFAARVRFDDVLMGYGQGEDLEFSLRLKSTGRLAMVGTARCEHHHAPAGRPDPFRLGHMEIRNRHRIWRRMHGAPGLAARTAFAYVWTLDTLFLMRDAIRPQYARDGLRRIAGRICAAKDILSGRSPA